MEGVDVFFKKWENPFQKTTSLLIQILSEANEWNISSSLTRHVENYLTNFFWGKIQGFFLIGRKTFLGTLFKKKCLVLETSWWDGFTFLHCANNASRVSQTFGTKVCRVPKKKSLTFFVHLLIQYTLAFGCNSVTCFAIIKVLFMSFSTKYFCYF